MASRLPPLKALRAFEVAGRHLSFMKAAADLNVTPGAISRQIKLLEDYLGLRLFERGYREVTLTPAGREYVDSLEEIFGRLEAATDRLMDQHHRKPLHIFASMMFTMRWLMPRLGKFEGASAGEIRLSTSLAADPNPFRSGNVDAAIYIGNADLPGMVCRRLLPSRLVPICSPALLRVKPLRNLDELGQHTLLHSSVFPNNWGNWLAIAGRPDIRGQQSVSFGSTSLAYQAAVEGLGVAIGQTTLIREDLAAGRLVVPFPQVLEDGNAYILAYPEAGIHHEMLTPFVRWLQAEAASDQKRGS
ncbi:LysR family glycine cleavage system transcriptional activator [Rhizobium sp. BK313]|uniref:transcriptional regulator GcvA n=1 Tax=Rhizobium sp. BK313 TaxID=2587081 RepID=UPI00105DCB89|nr:transcriptional regulator GcvA [Rhizobium sp. BK313]MBB3459309.1 LysR family glycine cleavage system transcriptional activator [Rhizobium sp. BK313]